jgi:DNA-binding transcriptional regulator YiaG
MNKLLARLERAAEHEPIPRGPYTPEHAKAIRLDSGVSIELMAAAVGVSSRSVANWESGATWPHPTSSLRWHKITRFLDSRRAEVQAA